MGIIIGENKKQSIIKSEVFTGHKPVPVKLLLKLWKLSVRL